MFTYIGIIVFFSIFLSMGALLLCWFCFAHRYFAKRANCDEHHIVDTEDGWQLHVYRYLPKHDNDQADPVVLCHGLGVNHFCFDISKQNSYPRYLARHGYDCWLINLRGRSQAKAPRNMKEQCSYADYVDYDIPAVLKLVCQKTGKDRVHWLGHSMGGMIAYAYLGQGGTGIKSLVAIAALSSPPTQKLIKLTMKIWNSLLFRINMRYTFLIKCFSWLIWIFPHPFVHFVSQGAVHQNRHTIMRSIWLCLEDINGYELQAFHHWYLAHKLPLSGEQQTSNLLLQEINIPIYIITSSGDYLVPPALATHIYHINKKTSIDVLELPNSKHSESYGHGDFLLSNKITDDILPHILVWFDKFSQTK